MAIVTDLEPDTETRRRQETAVAMPRRQTGIIDCYSRSRLKCWDTRLMDGTSMIISDCHTVT